MKLSAIQPVIDQAERLRVADRDRSERSNSPPRRFAACACPVALALRQAGFANAVIAATKWMTGGRQYDLPAEAQKFIADFDAGLPVLPAVLEVEGPARRPNAPPSPPTPASVRATATQEATNR